MATANSRKTDEKYPNRFKPGQSGNPNGRPKKTQEQKDALQAIRDLAPQAADELSKILSDNSASHAVKLKAIDMILERTYGKAEAVVSVNDPQRDSLSELREELRKIKAAGAGD